MASVLLTLQTRSCNVDICNSAPCEKSLTKWNLVCEKVRVSCLRLRELPSICKTVEASEARDEREEGKYAQNSRRWTAVVVPIATTLGAAAAAVATAFPREDAQSLETGRVELRTLNGCGLGVARYPNFVYNAEGGFGSGQARRLSDGTTQVQFDADGLRIPAVGFGTTRILGLPLPPGLKIEVVPKALAGVVDRRSGFVELDLLADFCFTVGSLYRPPPLIVDAKLTTESAEGVFRRGRGRRLDSSGNVKLVAVARLAPVNDSFLNAFLTLPTDCLAELSANLSFS